MNAPRLRPDVSEQLRELTVTLGKIAADREADRAIPKRRARRPGKLQMARQAQKAMKLRSRYFADPIIADPGWAILLDVYLADLQGTRICISAICATAGVPSTTALRWISRLTADGLLAREDDETDRRRAFSVLSTKGRNALDRYFQALTDL